MWTKINLQMHGVHARIFAVTKNLFIIGERKW